MYLQWKLKRLNKKQKYVDCVMEWAVLENKIIDITIELMDKKNAK